MRTVAADSDRLKEFQRYISVSRSDRFAGYIKIKANGSLRYKLTFLPHFLLVLNTQVNENKLKYITTL